MLLDPSGDVIEVFKILCLVVPCVPLVGGTLRANFKYEYKLV